MQPKLDTLQFSDAVDGKERSNLIRATVTLDRDALGGECEEWKDIVFLSLKIASAIITMDATDVFPRLKALQKTTITDIARIVSPLLEGSQIQEPDDPDIADLN